MLLFSKLAQIFRWPIITDAKDFLTTKAAKDTKTG